MSSSSATTECISIPVIMKRNFIVHNNWSVVADCRRLSQPKYSGLDCPPLATFATPSSASAAPAAAQGELTSILPRQHPGFQRTQTPGPCCDHTDVAS